MPKFNVEVTEVQQVRRTNLFIVEADNEESALDIARDKYLSGKDAHDYSEDVFNSSLESVEVISSPETEGCEP